MGFPYKAECERGGACLAVGLPHLCSKCLVEMHQQSECASVTTIVSITMDDIPYFKNEAILISMSSGNHELNIEQFLEEVQARRLKLVNEDVIKSKDIHVDVQFRTDNGTFTIVNGGMPISFDGKLTCVPGLKIQQTLTMFVAAAVQGSNWFNSGSSTCGIIALDCEFQEWLTKEFKQYED